MSKVKTFRASPEIERLLAELFDTGDFRSEGEVIQTAIKGLAILEKLSSKDKKKEPLYSILLLYRNTVSIEELYSIVEQVSIVPIQYSTIHTDSKKQEKKESNPKKREESYEQKIHLSERVKAEMPFGEEFKSAWIAWRQHFKRKHNDHMTPNQELAQFKRITDTCTSESEAVHSINYSITQNYAGIHFDRSTKKAKGGTRFDRDKAEAIINQKFRAEGE